MYRPHPFAFEPFNGMAVRTSLLLEPDESFALNEGGSSVLWLGWRARIDLLVNCAKHQVRREIKLMFAHERRLLGL